MPTLNQLRKNDRKQSGFHTDNAVLKWPSGRSRFTSKELTCSHHYGRRNRRCRAESWSWCCGRTCDRTQEEWAPRQNHVSSGSGLRLATLIPLTKSRGRERAWVCQKRTGVTYVSGLLDFRPHLLVALNGGDWTGNHFDWFEFKFITKMCLESPFSN